MTKVTRQRKATVATQVAALPATSTDTATLAAKVEAPAHANGVVVARSAAKPAIKLQAPPAEAAKPGKAVKQHGKKADARSAAKPAQEAPKPKAKLVRDSFTMPKDEYELLAVLKQRGTQLQRHVKKSELLRAGIAALHSMSDKNFLLALDRAPSLKTGRPKADAATDDGTAG